MGGIRPDSFRHGKMDCCRSVALATTLSENPETGIVVHIAKATGFVAYRKAGAGRPTVDARKCTTNMCFPAAAERRESPSCGRRDALCWSPKAAFA